MNKVAIKYQAFLDKANAFAAAQKRQNISPTPELARAALDAIGQMALAKVEIANIVDEVVSLPDRIIPVRIYDPQPDMNKPILVFIHGGGHMCGNVDLYDGISRRLAITTNNLVVSIEYRLAPEFPYPCGLDDCQAVVEDLGTLLKNFRVDLQCISLASDSAGGALATTIAWQSHRNRSVKISNLVLIYPSLDYTFSTSSYESLASGYLLETERIHWYFDHYFKHAEDRKQASPLFFTELDIMPKTLILAAALDPLVEEGKQFHKKLVAAGVESEYHEGIDLIHCFLNLEVLNPAVIDQTYQTIAKFLNRA